MTAPIDVAVVGVGYLGRLHAEKYAAHPRARLRALVDPDPAARRVAERLGVPWLADWSELPHEVRAVSVAVPTQLHYTVGRGLLESGRDVLVEKPIAASLAEADALIGAAESHGRLLQVGHLERFNPAIRRVGGFLREPRFIESHRLAPWTVRGTDVDVVLDLMIHDIDIILSLVRSEAVAIHAAGVPVVSNGVDIANARIVFADGCVANVTASRVSAQQMRKIRVFQPNAYVSIDFLRRSATIVRRRVGASTAAPASGRGFAGPFTGDGADPASAPPGALLAEVTSPPPGTLLAEPTSAAPGRMIADPTFAAPGTVIAELADARGGPGVTIVREEVSFADGETDALALEIDAFLAAVAGRTEPPVTGRDGRRALAVANRIVAQIGRGAGVTEWSSRGEENAP